MKVLRSIAQWLTGDSYVCKYTNVLIYFFNCIYLYVVIHTCNLGYVNSNVVVVVV